MTNILTMDDIGTLSSIRFTRSKHERDNRNVTFDNLGSSADAVIGRDGRIYSNKTIIEKTGSFLVVGGIDKFVNQEMDYEPEIYITDSQLRTIQEIMMKVARNKVDVNITADDEWFQDMLSGIAIRSA